jgi:hypothetical protein
VSIDNVIECILALEQGSLLAKMDIKEAYHKIPVHPQDCHQLAVRWKGVTYVYKVLPFGLRSSAIIFSAVADALQWLMERWGAKHIYHYVDDFITIGKPNSPEDAATLAIIKSTCSITEAPIEENKCKGLTTSLTFLGMELDTIEFEIYLPHDKLERLQKLTSEWKGQKAGKKRDFLSLVGTLNHACKAVGQGRTFLRRLIDVSKMVKHPDHFIRLNAAARSYIMWWYEFACLWNGVSMLSDKRRANPDVLVMSDASGKWGCRAYCEGDRFLGAQDGSSPYNNKGIIIAACLWGRKWSKKALWLSATMLP